MLIDILRDVPYIDFDHCLAWEGTRDQQFCVQRTRHAQCSVDWSQPDQLAFATVSALLHVSSSHPEHRKAATDAIIHFVGQIVEMLKQGDRMCDTPHTVSRSIHDHLQHLIRFRSSHHPSTGSTVLSRLFHSRGLSRSGPHWRHISTPCSRARSWTD